LPADAPVRYLATARRWPGDIEWDARIDAHRARRPPGWTTVEEPDVPALLRAAEPGAPLLVDDLATWLTGVLDDAQAWEQPTVPAVVGERVAALVDAVAACPGRVVLVSAEVGLFRDELGALNAALAAVSDDVLLLVAGLALRLK
jgi:adenosylcobinamide kinase / adenosylcobinamide-phosphate guanylyltransferase